MSQADTKQRILDTAEHYFAHGGFHNTSLRTITHEASANLAAVHYHFGSKEGLLEAVLLRRLEPLNQLREQHLLAVRTDARQQGRPPAVHDILHAFIEPTLHYRERHDGSQDFITLIGKAFLETDDTVRRLFIRHIETTLRLLLDLLGEALPQMGANDLFWRLQFVLGAVSHTMCRTGVPFLIPQGSLAPPCNTDNLIQQLTLFVTAGMEADPK